MHLLAGWADQQLSDDLMPGAAGIVMDRMWVPVVAAIRDAMRVFAKSVDARAGLDDDRLSGDVGWRDNAALLTSEHPTRPG